MATPTAYGAPAPMMEHPELASLKSILNLAKILALIVMILAVLGALLDVAAAVSFNSVWGFYPSGDFVGAGYLLISAVVLFLIWQRIPAIEAMVNNRQYSQAKNDLLIWMILGFVFTFIVGLVLLIGYIKFDTIIASGGAVPVSMVGGYAAPPAYGQPTAYAPQPGYGQPAPYGQAPAAAPAPAPGTAAPPAAAYQYQPAPSAPAAPPMAPAAAPGTTPCPRCGRPLTWIPQYSRWYCYSDQQYRLGTWATIARHSRPSAPLSALPTTRGVRADRPWRVPRGPPGGRSGSKGERAEGRRSGQSRDRGLRCCGAAAGAPAGGG